MTDFLKAVRDGYDWNYEGFSFLTFLSLNFANFWNFTFQKTTTKPVIHSMIYCYHDKKLCEKIVSNFSNVI